MDGGGVRLFGKITTDAQITDYGFEYGEDSLLVNNTRLSLGSTVAANFHADILLGLVSGHKYFFKAYETLSGVEKYGKTLSFLSQGSKPMIISRVTPATAGMGDTITIHGKYFDPKKTGVYFDNTQAQVLQMTDSVAVCIIPYLPAKYNNGLILKDEGRYTYQNFILAAPVITSFTDRKFIGDTVQINGDNFDKVANFATEVDFGTAKATIVSTSRKKILAVVPTIYSSTVNIKVAAQFQSVTSSTAFTLAAPTITQIPASATTLSDIIIKGNYFFPLKDYDYNQVFVNGVKADIFAADKNSIKFRVPEAPYPNRKATIAVNVLGQTVNYTGTLNITDKWLMMGQNLPFANPFKNCAFVVNNQAYCMAYANGTRQISVFKYDAAANTWALYQQLPQLNSNCQGTAVVGGKVYMYSVTTTTGSFWQYDPALKRLTAEAAFPGPPRNVPAIFAIGNSVYMGFGTDVGGFLDFYAYNTQTNTWKKAAGISSNEFDGIAGYFSAAGKGYIVYQTYDGNALQEYDPQTDTWTAKARLAGGYGRAIGFSLNNMGYVFGVTVDNYSNNCFQYNPKTNTWTQKDKVGFGTHVNASFAFSMGTQAYAGWVNNDGTATTVYSAESSVL